MLELHHRPRAKHSESPSGGPCEFCSRNDPHFDKRNPIDQLVRGEAYVASGHLSEDGRLAHLLIELRKRTRLAA